MSYDHFILNEVTPLAQNILGAKRSISLRNISFCTFFLLEQKEPKIQESRIASGRHSTLRACVATCFGRYLS
ncbi:MAG: hypothetical protein EOP42_27860 [Sphingobacteriaceae bacterium]|nr:MAG: hypothetical protein EOP42_27860 [Sphingobacteriaceae bacterium]